MRRELPETPESATPSTANVRAFWEWNPVAAATIEAQLGTPEFFAAYERLRQIGEPYELQEEIYGFDHFANRMVLDVGCGNGYVLSRYARNGSRTYGVDLTWTAMNLSAKRFTLENVTGWFAQGDAEHLPFCDASFDLVLSMGVLHHIPHIEAAIAEIHRVLKPGGVTILMLYHRNSFHYRVLYPLYGLLHPAFRGHRPAEIARRIDGSDNPIGRAYTRRQVVGLLTAFRDIQLRVRSLPIRQLLPLPGGKLLLDLFGRRVGWSLYAQAIK
jgi:SAM-dependent methyltransferase